MKRNQAQVGQHEITSDLEANPALRAQMATLRGSMVAAAEQNELPARFAVKAALHRPAMIITDTVTGKSATVPMFSYGAVRKTLNDLFA